MPNSCKEHTRRLAHLHVGIAIAVESQGAIRVDVQSVLGGVLTLSTEGISEAITLDTNVVKSDQGISCSVGLCRAADVLLANHTDESIHGVCREVHGDLDD